MHVPLPSLSWGPPLELKVKVLMCVQAALSAQVDPNLHAKAAP